MTYLGTGTISDVMPGLVPAMTERQLQALS